MESQLKIISKYSDNDLKKYFNKEDINFLHQLKLYLDDKYYNRGEEVYLSDHQYDLLKEILQKRDPMYIPPIGAKIRMNDNRVELPFWLGSMDKLKPEDVLQLKRWLVKNESKDYVIESKLDGISCMLISKKGITKLYTRGDGIIGSDISYLTHYLKNIPKKIDEDIAIRGELIIRKDVFSKKYSSEFKNPRNMVAGRIAGKTARSGLEDIEFIAYEIIDNHTLIKPEEQLLKLVEMDFHVVNYSIVNSLKIENLIEIFMNFKDNTIFEIDGIIIQPNIPYKRNKSGNPSYAFAFKVRLDTNLVDAEVEEVEWNISRWGLLKPKIRIKPVFLNGVTITYTSGFNARYIEDNQIGPKSIIKLTRSGDVIPFIVEVIKKTKAQMPDISYKWNETHVDIYTEENENIVCIKVITNIFASLNIKHVSELTVSKLYNHGLDNLLKIIYASKEDFEEIEGFGKRLSERTYNNIHQGLQNISLSTLLGGSSIFGRGIGVKKIEVLLEAIPDILELYSTISKKKLFKRINEVKGFSDKTTKNIIDNLPWAIKFVEKMKPFISIKIEINISNDLKSMIFVFSGFRDKKLEEEIIKRGGKVSTSVSSNTTCVIANNLHKITGKVQKAMDLNIDVYEKENFLLKFNLI